MAKKTEENGQSRLKQDLKAGTIGSLYVLYGPESHLKAHYLQEIEHAIVDEAFRDFNRTEFEGASVTAQQLSDAIESYPAMAERRLVVVRDLDLYKPPKGMKDDLIGMLSDLPPYICLVFYYDTMDLQPDKRLKIHSVLTKNACMAECTHLDERALASWIRRRVRALGKDIDDRTCAHLIFHCGNAMTNLAAEIEKAAAFSTLDTITAYHIDTVCTRVLDAVIFDVTDAIAAADYVKAVALVHDLIAQKHAEVQIFGAILRHMQRLYAAKLAGNARGGERSLMELIGSRSSYYAGKLIASARAFSLPWLRECMLLCAKTDAALKSTAADRQKEIELTLLTMAAGFGASVC